MTRFPAKLIMTGLIFIALIAVLFMTFGINNAGPRTVVQYPTGHLCVKFTPGIYPQLFGSTEIYNDVITFDFDKLNGSKIILRRCDSAIPLYHVAPPFRYFRLKYSEQCFVCFKASVGGCLSNRVGLVCELRCILAAF